MPQGCCGSVGSTGGRGLSGGHRAGVGEERRCPHCGTGGAVSRGKSRGLRRYRCKSCGRTFGALTGTALSGLHRKERWLSFAASLAEGETIRGAAVRCGIAPSTAFRWRHRFLAAVRQSPDRLAGIVEADETFVLESRKGERNLNRRPRRRGGKARKRGLSREQVPILVAADRGGATLSRTLPKLDADSVKRALAPVIAPDALLVSDAGRCHRPAAAALGILHESVNRSAGERVRGAVHIQTVNSRHSQIKGFLRRFRGIATKCLDSYLRWFHLVILGRHPSPRACLAAASARSCLRFAN